MKIATWNINGITRRLTLLLAWLEDAEPDIVCLQDMKSTRAAFPEAGLERAGYRSVWECDGRWNGVAILARGRTPVLTRTSLPGNDVDRQARFIEAAVAGIVIASIYVPNGNPQPGPKFDFKLEWLTRLRRHASTLLAQNVPLVLAGDFNVAPTAHDIYDETTSYRDSALIHPGCRDAFHELLKAGLSDALRKVFGDEEFYTFWDYRRRRWERNAGLRLDHVLLDGNSRSKLAGGGVDRPVRSWKDASDHVPAWVKLRT